MKKKRKSYIIDIRAGTAYTNISNPRVSPLYDYFRHRIGIPRYPISNRQRYAFDKIIINMCRCLELPAEYWIFNHPKINYYSSNRWVEYRDDVIEDASGYELSYKDVRDEIILINRMLRAKRNGKEIELSSDDEVTLGRILYFVHCPVVREINALRLT